MKKYDYLLLIMLTILIGSFINFYATNLVFSDISNMFYGVHDVNFISTIPLFLISVDFVVLMIFLMRFSRYPMYRKSYAKLYSVYLIVNSSVAAIASLLSGIIVYPSLVSPYPFFAYPLIMLIVNLLLTGLGLFIRLYVYPRMNEDVEQKKQSFKSVSYSIVLGVMTYYAFAKFGSFLWSPLYISFRTLDVTWPFYLALLSPLALLIHVLIYFFDGYKNRPLANLITISTITFVSLVLNILVLVFGSTYSEAISAISPALGLERLATSPIDSIFQPVALLLLGGYYILYAIRSLKISKK